MFGDSVTCEMGHWFAVAGDHPYVDSKPVCPVCQAGEVARLQEAVERIRRRLDLIPIEEDQTHVNGPAFALFMERLEAMYESQLNEQIAMELSTIRQVRKVVSMLRQVRNMDICLQNAVKRKSGVTIAENWSMSTTMVSKIIKAEGHKVGAHGRRKHA